MTVDRKWLKTVNFIPERFTFVTLEVSMFIYIYIRNVIEFEKMYTICITRFMSSVEEA